MKWYLASIFFLVLLPNCLRGQSKKVKSEYIPDEHLRMKTYAQDTSAGAVVLFSNGVYTYRDDLWPELQVHKRIKILKVSGYDAANISITYRFTGNTEKISNLKATSYNLLSNGEVEVTKLEGSMIFDEDIDGEWHRKKFTIPNVKAGSVIEYAYTKSSATIFYGPEWYFQSEYPVLNSRLEASIPNGIDYVFLLKDPNQYTRSNTEPTHIDVRMQGSTITLVGTKNIWQAANLPAFKQEQFLTSVVDYITKINFQLSRINLPGMLPQNFLNTWENFNKKLFEDIYAKRQINGKGPIRELTDSLVKEVPDPLQRMKNIYDWVRDNMVYTDYQNITGSADLNKVFNQRKGDLSDIAILLTLMLKHAGLDAGIILTSTWANGYPQKIYPIVEQFDYLITIVYIGNNHYLLDATDPHRPWNLLPYWITDRPGLVVQNDAVKWVDIPATGKQKRTIHTIGTLDSTGLVTGKISIADEGYCALDIRSNYARAENMNQFINLYKFGTNAALHIELDTAKNLESPDATLSSRYHFSCSIGNTVESYLYFNPLPLEMMVENPFKSEFRTYPVDFGYLTQFTAVTDVNLPGNITVEELPTNIVKKLPGNAAEIRRIAALENGKISIKISLTINKSHFETEEYPGLREFMEQYRSICNEPIVLKKAL